MTDFVPVQGRRLTRAERKALDAENKKWPKHLVQCGDAEIGYPRPPMLKEVRPGARAGFWSRSMDAGSGLERLSIHRTTIKNGRWSDGILWDDMQRLKSECGRGDKCGVEVYPADEDLVNVANVRHVFILPEAPAFAWKKASDRRHDRDHPSPASRVAAPDQAVDRTDFLGARVRVERHHPDQHRNAMGRRPRVHWWYRVSLKETIMATITIRKLDDEVVDRLKEIARQNGRSMESELRMLFTRIAREPDPDPPSAPQGAALVADDKRECA